MKIGLCAWRLQLLHSALTSSTYLFCYNVFVRSMVPFVYPIYSPKNIFIVHSCGLLSSNPDARLSTLPFLLPCCLIANADWIVSSSIEHDCNCAERLLSLVRGDWLLLSVITRDLNLGTIKLSNRIPTAFCQMVHAKVPRYLTSVFRCPVPCAFTDSQWPIWHAFWLNNPEGETGLPERSSHHCKMPTSLILKGTIVSPQNGTAEKGIPTST